MSNNTETEIEVRSFEEHWQEIEKNFRWQRVYDVMKFLDWQWSVSPSGQMYIPGIDAMKTSAKRLLKDAYEKTITMTATGGFQAGYIKDHDLLWLNFTVEEWVTDK